MRLMEALHLRQAQTMRVRARFAGVSQAPLSDCSASTFIPIFISMCKT